MKAAVTFIAFAVLFNVLVWTFGRMACDEMKIRTALEYAYASDSHITEWNCSSSVFTDTCSGTLDTPKSSVPVRYTCDKDRCQFECGK